MKKKIYTFMLMLMVLLNLTGCLDKETEAYCNEEDIVVETWETDKVARITIRDTYTKNNITYYVFTTDASGSRRFTLSEADYDKFIGLKNDAVDCTVYSMKCSAEVFSYKYFIGLDQDLCDNIPAVSGLLEKIPEVDYLGVWRVGSGTTDIVKAYDKLFQEGEYMISVDEEEGEISLKSTIFLQHYSFVGEEDFTDATQDYIEIMNKMNNELVIQCRSAVIDN